ncbi:MAG TPA: hypothetical protein PLG99_12265, partial [Kaistiaceae bacterium]|nr:hypothetical protein [Kaistiaceae bacterium]
MGQVVDFRPIAGDDIDLFRIGDDLEVLFADGAYVLIRGFFAAGNGSQAQIVLADDVAVTLAELAELAELVDIAVIEAVQTAAGSEGGGTSIADALSDQNGGHTFENPDIEGTLGTTLGNLGYVVM